MCRVAENGINPWIMQCSLGYFACYLSNFKMHLKCVFKRTLTSLILIFIYGMQYPMFMVLG